MRAHGVPSLSDPNSQGLAQIDAGVDPHSPVFRSAMNACRQLVPSGFGPPTAAQLAQAQRQLLAFAKCMRSHSIPDFPDPSGAALPRSALVGDLDPNNPRFQTAFDACREHLPHDLPIKALGGLTPPSETS
jgi:hypothetical protein